MLDPQTTYWFPMRVTYGREVRVRDFLNSIDVETFLPMTERTRRDGKHIRHERVPAISNLIFIHSEKHNIDILKHSRAEAEPLRYMTRPLRTDDGIRHEIIIVPDNQMDDFMHVASAPEDQRTFLTADDLRGKDGASVVISSGPFAGVEGVIKRIKGNRRVVVEIDGIGGVCINFVPKAFIIRKD